MLTLAPILLALAQAIAPGQAGAPVPPSTALSASAATPGSGDVVCKREAVTGSRLQATKICRTKAEWADMAAQAREATQQVQNQRFAAPR